MTPSACQAIVLAAGKSSRFKTGTTKLAFTLCGQEIIIYPLRVLQSLSIPTTVVVGYQKEAVQAVIAKAGISVAYQLQEQQLGTGHAVALTKSSWQADTILIMNGDVPLVTQELIEKLIEQHTSTQAVVSFVTAHHPDPALTGYGRVVTEKGYTHIVEAKDFVGDVTTACCINAGIYLFSKTFLEQYVEKLSTHNKAQELYLTDLIGIASKQGLLVQQVHAPYDEIRGINTLKELWTAEHIKRSELITHWMAQGVYFTAAQTVHIDLDIEIGAGTQIDAGVQITKGSRIGTDCTIGAFSRVEHSIIGDHVTIHSHSIVRDSTVNNHAEIGPFAHIRPHSSIGEKSIIGNFVEVNKSSIANATKIKHLSYIGNAEIGSHVNIGAGTIFVNYNGVTKSTTHVKDHAFIGSNNSLVAPVTIGNHAMTAAGSTITQDVPARALAIGRARQVIKEGYADRIKQGKTVINPATLDTKHQEENS